MSNDIWGGVLRGSETWLNEGFATYLHLMFEAGHFDLDLDDMWMSLPDRKVVDLIESWLFDETIPASL